MPHQTAERIGRDLSSRAGLGSRSRGSCSRIDDWHRGARRWRVERLVAAVRLRPLGQRPGLASIGPRGVAEIGWFGDRGKTTALAVEAGAAAGAPLPEPRRALLGSPIFGST
ncbi:MAG: hypothetical protein QOI65_1090 [Thermoleophilaceae bacterium]|jgi:hypothetical protein|nr:hypothetical protein [Thermoleophilaceae bacterium]